MSSQNVEKVLTFLLKPRRSFKWVDLLEKHFCIYAASIAENDKLRSLLDQENGLVNESVKISQLYSNLLQDMKCRSQEFADSTKANRLMHEKERRTGQDKILNILSEMEAASGKVKTLESSLLLANEENTALRESQSNLCSRLTDEEQNVIRIQQEFDAYKEDALQKLLELENTLQSTRAAHELTLMKMSSKVL